MVLRTALESSSWLWAAEVEGQDTKVTSVLRPAGPPKETSIAEATWLREPQGGVLDDS